MSGSYIPAGPPTTPDQAWSRAVEPRTGEGLDTGHPKHMHAQSSGQIWGSGFRALPTPLVGPGPGPKSAALITGAQRKPLPSYGGPGSSSVSRITKRELAQSVTQPCLGSVTLSPIRSQCAPQAPLTLDLLVDHQSKVVYLQDVRECAQRVRQADLEEKPCQCSLPWHCHQPPAPHTEEHGEVDSQEKRKQEKPPGGLEHAVHLEKAQSHACCLTPTS